MPANPMTTISQQLKKALLAVTNSLEDDEIRAAVKEYGFTTEKLNAGKELYSNALNAVTAAKTKIGEQKLATAALQEKRKAAADAYQAAAQVARAVLDSGSRTILGLNGKQPRTAAGLLQAGYTLFDAAASKGLLADYGYDANRLAAERAKIEAYDQASQRREAARGAAQQATQDQQKALALMNDWLAQYLKIAKVALRDKKQLLEKIGVPARTTKTAAQRKGPAKAAATRKAKKE
jgi:hypothetical protein